MYSEEGSGEITVENNGNGNGGGEVIISPSSDQQSRHSPNFPEGMRVLLVDDDPVCLKIVSQMLKKCHYQVTDKWNSAEALKRLKEMKEGEFDIVFTNVQMGEIDGFKILEVGLELDIPVVMMSSNDKTEVIMKGIRHGARDYLIKPLRMAEIKNIWQHVYRKNILPDRKMGSNNNYNSKIKQIRVGVDGGGDHEELEMSNARTIKNDIGTNSKSCKKSGKNKRKKPDGYGSGSGFGYEDGVMALANGRGGNKKERITWSPDLHEKFLDAVEKAGGATKAVPKQILETMATPGVTREKVASHLQKFRNIIKKKQELEIPNKLIMRSNNNNHNHNHLLQVPLPPPLPPQAVPLANNNYHQFRGHVMGPTTGYHTNINSNMIHGSQPHRQLMNNWMVHGGGYPQSLQAVRPMMVVQPHAQQQHLPRVMHPHKMDHLAPLPPQIGSNNFQHQQNVQIRDHMMMRPNSLGGQDCFNNELRNNVTQADDGVMLDNLDQGSVVVDSSFDDDLPGFQLDEELSCFLYDRSQ